MNSPLYISSGEPVGYWTLTIDENKFRINAGAAKILGQPDLRELSVTDFLDFIHPEDRPRFATSLTQVQKTSAQDVHYRIPGPNGSQKIVQQIGSLYDGTLQGIIQDITLRETQLRKTMRENQELAEAQSIALIGRWELDLLANDLHWSSGIFEMFEVDPDRFDASYEAFLDTIHPEDRDRVDHAYRDSLRTKKPYEIEHRLLFPDGRIKWVKEKCRTFFDEYGKPYRSAGIVQDITKQKLNELQLLKMETFLQRTSEVAGVGGWEINMDTGELFWSEVTKQIHEVPENYTPNVKDAISFYATSEGRKQVEHAFYRAVEAKESFQMELPLRTWTGRFIWIETRGEAEWEDNRCLRVFGTFQDITARKEIERKQEEEHRQALDRNRAKSEFISNLSHELRTPMNAILGFAQLLKKKLPETRRGVELDEILKAGDYMRGLLEDVLDLSRVESRDLEVSIGHVSATDLIQKCIQLSGSLENPKSVTLQFQMPDHTILFKADPLRSQQSLLNVLSNSIKYNRDQGKVIVAVQEVSDRVRIAVTDTGFGIPREKQSQLFRPFERLGMEATEIEGTGIGLVLTRNLLRLMGGDLFFNSVPGEGSTFYLEFPVANSDAALPQTPIGRDVFKNSRNDAVHGSLLYIEDNPLNMRLMEHVLLDLPGIVLHKATTVEQGLEKAKKEQIDLLLIDQRLPDGHGFDVIRELRTWPEYRDKPAICISANAMESEISDAIEAGFDDYLTKPLNLDELHSKLYNYLR